MRTIKEQIADFNAKRHKYIDYVELMPGGWIRICGVIGSMTYLYYTFCESAKKYNAEVKEANKND